MENNVVSVVNGTILHQFVSHHTGALSKNLYTQGRFVEEKSENPKKMHLQV